MRIVDRQGFINHVNGDLLIRDSFGRCQVGDGVEFEEAVKDMVNGNKIGLTVKGQLFSIMENYQERLFKKEEI